MNYYNQLCEMYPEKREQLWYLQYPLHHHLYAYGDHSSLSWEHHNGRYKWKALFKFVLEKYIKGCKNTKEKTIVSDVIINFDNFKKHLVETGYNVLNLSNCLSVKSFYFLNNFVDTNFNQLLSTNCGNQLNAIKTELMFYFEKYDVRFVLLSNDALPLQRLAINVCKEMGIPSGVFLHGLPASYSLGDNCFADYTFVWGRQIMKNYEEIGAKNKILISGSPKASIAKTLPGNHDKVVVISFCAGDVYDGDNTLIADRGLCVQYANSVQSVLQKTGVNHAMLRVHPHEKVEWYRKFVDTNFYKLDTNGLIDTLKEASYLIGPISSVLIDAVSHHVPFYPYLITKEVNAHSWDEAPPYRIVDGLPVARSTEELYNNLLNGHCVEERHLRAYYAEKFDISVITDCFKE